MGTCATPGPCARASMTVDAKWERNASIENEVRRRLLKKDLRNRARGPQVLTWPLMRSCLI